MSRGRLTELSLFVQGLRHEIETKAEIIVISVFVVSVHQSLLDLARCESIVWLFADVSDMVNQI